MIVHTLSGAPLPIHVRSVGLNLGVEQSGRGGVLCARSGKMLGKSLLSSAAVRKGACRDLGRWVSELNLRISQEQEIGRRCAVVGFPPQMCVTPVLLRPGSDTRMRMRWKNMTKTEKSGVWFFPECRGYVGEVGTPVAYGCCGLGLVFSWVWGMVVPWCPPRGESFFFP